LLPGFRDKTLFVRSRKFETSSEGDIMPIWELSPTDQKSDDWRSSKHRERVVVRAPTVDKARDLVSSKFHDMSKRAPGGDTPLNPWRQPDLVTCKRLNDSAYDENGPDEILEPATT
jgi:hypothetical protein